MSELDKHKAKTIIVVDGMGQHSGTWCSVLQKAGYTAAKALRRHRQLAWRQSAPW